MCIPSATNKHRERSPPIGWRDYGTAITLTNGNTFTVTTDLDQRHLDDHVNGKKLCNLARMTTATTGDG